MLESFGSTHTEAKAQCILGTVVSVDAVGIILSTIKARASGD